MSQLVLSVNLVRWWQILEVLQLQPQKSVMRLHLRVCGDSMTFTCSSKTVHQHTELARWLSFWLARHQILAPMLFSADTINIFH